MSNESFVSCPVSPEKANENIGLHASILFYFKCYINKFYCIVYPVLLASVAFVVACHHPSDPRFLLHSENGILCLRWAQNLRDGDSDVINYCPRPAKDNGAFPNFLFAPTKTQTHKPK